MKAAILKRPGIKSKIIIKDIIKPKVHKDRILIKVHACSLNPIDFKIKFGKFSPLIAFKKHSIVASDFCGQIAAMGSNVKGFSLNQFVYGMINPLKTGTCAEYLSVKPSQIYEKPPNLDVYQAAALPLAALTAYQALVHLGNIKNQKRPKVLINGSSGGVGHLALQIAKAFGAHVTAVCSFRSRSFVQSLGADVILDYTKDALFHESIKYDILFDVQGNLLFSHVKKFITDDGCYINTTPDNLAVLRNTFAVLTSLMTKKKAKFILATPSSKDLKEIYNLVIQNKLKPVIEKTYSMDAAKEAFCHIEKGRTQGKIIIKTA